jgi:hypothetical protein
MTARPKPVQPRKPRKRGSGRPKTPIEDLRSDKIAFRIHPDLTAELAKIARANGEPRSTWIERLILASVNETYGYAVLDAIGKKIDYGDNFEQPQLKPAGTRPFRAGTFVQLRRPRAFSADDPELAPPPKKKRK